MDANLVKALASRVAALNPDLAPRIERAALLALLRRVEPVSETTWRVESAQPGLFYHVVFSSAAPGARCCCPDWPRAPRGLCKHILAVSLVVSCSAAPVAASAVA